jgi:NADH-quinone oxidoreductase subunit E
MYLNEVTQSRQGGAGSRADVVVIDDEDSMCEGCRQVLEADGYHTLTAPDGPRGLELVQQVHPRIVLVDLRMPGMSGMDVLAKVSDIDPAIVSIVITGYASIESAVQSMKIGALDFLAKPFRPEQLLDSVRRGMEASRTREQAVAPPQMEAPPRPMEAPDAALRGLEVIGQYYSLGLGKRDLLDELRHLEGEAQYLAETLGRIKEKEQVLLEVVTDLCLVDEMIARHEYRKSALLQILLDVQTRLNWLPRHALKWISRRLKVPLASVYTIANFYEAFSLVPRGAHLVEICTGTACHVRGASGVEATVTAILGIEPGQTDAERLFTLKTVHCMGCCALAPVIKIDDRYFSNPTMKELQKVFASYGQAKEQPCQS